MYVHTYVRMYVRTYARTYVRTYVRACVCTYVYAYVRAHVRTYVRTCVHTYVHNVRRYVRMHGCLRPQSHFHEARAVSMLIVAVGALCLDLVVPPVEEISATFKFHQKEMEMKRT